MKTIETLKKSNQVKNLTFVEDANATIIKNENRYFVTLLNYVKESKTFKTFKGAKNYMYK
jgi:hypothetical protein